MNTSDVIAALLDPETDDEMNLEVIQHLIDTGDAWQLEGSVGRAAMSAIDAGMVVLGATGHRDYWGTYIPGRDEIQPGSKGSVEYGHQHGGTDAGHSTEPTDRCPKCELLRGNLFVL